MFVADDHHLATISEQYRSALLIFFVLCSVAGVPLSWNKTAGGDIVCWAVAPLAPDRKFRTTSCAVLQVDS